jgi:hypothetical protein
MSQFCIDSDEMENFLFEKLIEHGLVPSQNEIKGITINVIEYVLEKIKESKKESTEPKKVLWIKENQYVHEIKGTFISVTDDIDDALDINTILPVSLALAKSLLDRDGVYYKIFEV